MNLIKPVISTIPTIIEKISDSKTLKESKNYLLQVAKNTTEIISPLVKNGYGKAESQVILTGIFNTLDKMPSSSVNGVREIAILEGGDDITKYFGFMIQI